MRLLGLLPTSYYRCEVLFLKPHKDRDVDEQHSTDFLNDILLNFQSFPKSSTLRMLFWNQRLTALLWTASQSQRIWTLLKTIQSESSVRLSTHWCMVWFWREIERLSHKWNTGKRMQNTYLLTFHYLGVRWSFWCLKKGVVHITLLLVQPLRKKTMEPRNIIASFKSSHCCALP